MKIVGQLKAILGLDKSKFDTGMGQAEKRTSKFAGLAAKLGGIFAAVFAVGKIAQWGKASVEAYKVQNEAEIKLATVIKQRMGLGQDAVDSLMKQAAAYQEIGVIGDEVQLSGLQQLATFVRQKESLDAMLPAMNNLLAQQKGNNATAMDAVNIANMMGKVLDGQVASLRRVGVSFNEAQGEVLKTGTELERAGMLAQVITDNVGNMNEEFGKTDLGKITKWKNAWGDFKEMLGAKLVPILGNIAAWGTRMLPKIADGFRAIRTALHGVINYFIDLYNESTAFRGVIQGIIFITKTLWASFKTGIATTLGYFKILGQVLKDVFTGNWKAIGDHVREGLQSIGESVRDYGKTVANNWDDMMENMTKKPHVQNIEVKAKVAGSGGGETIPVTEATAAAGKATDELGEDYWQNQIKAAAEYEDFISQLHKTQGEETAEYWRNQIIAAAEYEEFLEGLKGTVTDYGKLTEEVFMGLQNSFYEAFTSNENVLQAFGKAFADFIKSMIARLAAATAASLALAAVMMLIPGLGATMGFKSGSSFGKIFGGLMKKGIGIGMANGGTVPPGYPNDSFGPVMLSSGETVLTASQSNGLNGKIDITVHGDIAGRAIAILGRRTEVEN